MSVEVWQELPKNQNDPEKIEEAIDRKIQDHNDDVNAHLDDNQALKSHRAEDIIDHLANSIVTDKIRNFNITREKLTADKFYIDTCWESLDFWQVYGNGFIQQYLGGIVVFIDGGNNHIYTVESQSDILPINWNTSDFVFETMVKISSGEDIVVYIGVGNFDDNFIGFRLSEGRVMDHTVNQNGGEEDFSADFNTSEYHRYRIEYKHGLGAFWYVDDELVFERNTDLPSSTETLINIHFHAKITDAFQHSFRVLNTRYFQTF